MVDNNVTTMHVKDWFLACSGIIVVLAVAVVNWISPFVK